MNSKGVALIVVIGLILSVVVLANVALVIIHSHSTFTVYQVKTISAYYAAQAGINLVFEQLRVGNIAPQLHIDGVNDATCDDTYFCINGLVDDNLDPLVICSDVNVDLYIDPLIPHNVQIRIFHLGGGAGVATGTTQLEVKVRY